jgi:hypothetical protein
MKQNRNNKSQSPAEIQKEIFENLPVLGCGSNTATGL